MLTLGKHPQGAWIVGINIVLQEELLFVGLQAQQHAVCVGAPRAQHMVAVTWNGDGGQYRNDRDDDRQLDQGESTLYGLHLALPCGWQSTSSRRWTIAKF